jgi:MFS family permease
MALRSSPTLIIFLLWCAGLGAAAQFGKMSVLFDDLRLDYAGHTAVELGLIVSVVGIVGLVLGTTAGLFVARIGPRRVIIASMMMGAAVSVLQSLGLSYGQMIASRVVEGLSHLGIVVVGPTLIASLAPERHRGFAMTLWSSFFGVSYTLLALFAGAVITRFGVEGLYIGHALWMALLGALLYLVLPADPRSAPATDTAGLLTQHALIYRSASLSAPALGFFSYTFLYVAMLTLLPAEMPVGERALVAVGMPLISIIASMTLGVWLLSKVTAVQLVQIGYLLTIPGFVGLAVLWGQGAGMAASALWIAATLGLVQGASFAAVPQIVVLPADRARAAGAIAQMGNLGTTTGTPVLAAILVGLGPWGMMIAAGFVCTLGIGLHALQARRRARSDAYAT